VKDFKHKGIAAFINPGTNGRFGARENDSKKFPLRLAGGQKIA
jgi:hypothetical protein